MHYPSVIIILIGAILVVLKIWSRGKWHRPTESMPTEWRSILAKNIAFYGGLDLQDKSRFEYEVQEFLLNCKITGISTDVNLTDRLLVASSAVIPIFGFPEWKYTNLHEVLLYPSSFNEDFQTKGDQENKNILGMVGSGYMEGKMILSKQALEMGFANESDKKNTAIHEFVHLLDKSDGATDGIPKALLERQYTIPWINMIEKEIAAIYDKQSDINPYGATNRAEFFAVSSEYFFERPHLMAKKHPELYGLLELVFHTDMEKREMQKESRETGRNDDCPCGSGKKFKHCCGE